jgi:hypothetical protein
MPRRGQQKVCRLLPNGNRVNRLAASHEHFAAPVQVRIRHKRCPLRATPIYSVSTLSWLRSAPKRLPSFALDSCSLVTSLQGIKRKTTSTILQSTSNPIRYPWICRESAISRPVEGKKVPGLNRPPTRLERQTVRTAVLGQSLTESKRKVHGAQIR